MNPKDFQRMLDALDDEVPGEISFLTHRDVLKTKAFVKGHELTFRYHQRTFVMQIVDLQVQPNELLVMITAKLMREITRETM